MLKRLMVLMLVFCVLVGFMPSGTLAVEQGITVTIDGKVVTLEGAKVFVGPNSKVLCPISYIAGEMGAKVEWLPKTSTVLISRGSDIIRFNPGITEAFVNDKKVVLDTKPSIIKGRTYVSLQFISDILSAVVDFDRAANVLKIESVTADRDPLFNQNLTTSERGLSSKLDEYLQALEKYKNFHGSVLVAKDGKVLLDKGYGKADFEQNIKINQQTKLAIGSVTKQFTAMAVMQLHEKGLLDVNDKLSKYFPDYPRGSEITIHHLLTHTSGIANYTDYPANYELKQTDEETIISTFKNLPLNFEPGTNWAYSNSGYLLLGYIVEKVSGMSYEDYLDKNIFQPLGMKRTGICYNGDDKLYQAVPYQGYLEVIPIDDAPLLKIAHGAGNLYSTVEDLYRWDRALYTEKLVSKKTMDMILTPYMDTPLGGAYGYGWLISTGKFGKEVAHSGGTLGFSAYLLRCIEQDLVVTILVNNQAASVSTISNTLRDIVMGEKYELPTEHKIAIVNPAVYDSYVGKYQLDIGGNVEIAKENNKLYILFDGQQKAQMFPESETKYFLKVVDSQITFIKNDKGEVYELEMLVAGTSVKAKNLKYKAERKIAQVDPKVYDSYVGEYELMPGFIITITKENNSIYARATGQEKFEVYPESETKYFYKVVDAQITFVKNDKGEVTGVILHQMGRDMEAKKIK
ncbi:MAG: serine hydrolase [Clostridia bacterium]|nr:serine hydrolase [Clostridia bacterium]